MSATLTRYSVPGWGVGQLWTAGRVVLAHDFDFVHGASGDGALARRLADLPAHPADDLGAYPPKGAVSPPTGTLTARSTQVGNVFVTIPQNGRAPRRQAMSGQLATRIGQFLGGQDARFDDVELDLTWATPFQRAVADALRAVPRGEVVTYGELAAIAGHPGAARAAGSFCAANRFALFVPCHRVVSASGIGGYGSTGAGVKRRLLALEGVVV